MSLFRIERLPHLPIEQTSKSPERKKKENKHHPPSPQSGDRGLVAKEFEVAIERLETEAKVKTKKLPQGIDPHLVFKMPVFEGANLNQLEEKLERVGLSVVSVDADKEVIVVFRSETDLSDFRQSIETYKQPKANSKTTVFDIFEWVKPQELASLTPADRIGEGLAEIIGSEGENIEDEKLYQVLDVEVWPSGTSAQDAQRNLEEIRALGSSTEIPRQNGERVTDTFSSADLCMARVRFSGARLRKLLEMDVVAIISVPPQPSLGRGEILGGTPDDFPPIEPLTDDQRGPRLCVLDSGIVSSHPLLAPNVGYEDAFLTDVSTIADENGHGTRVAGIAVYGDLRRCRAEKRFQSPITLYSGRILNEHNELDDEKLFITQIRSALDAFTKEPYGCRIFNLSFGRREPWAGKKQTTWGEALDKLAREYKVLFVVSSGNVTTFETPMRRGDDAAQQKARYHACLLEDEWRLCDPAMAALAVTVGAITDLAIPPLDDDLKFPVAGRNQPSPFARCGPGVTEAMKPDFVEEGGNLILSGYDQMRKIERDPVTSVISLHNEPTDRLFAVDIGTSMAAPRVAHIASLTEWRLWQDLGARPHPNLVRAVMATAASIPPAARELFGSDSVYRACGYGRINPDFATTSRGNRVLLCAESEVELDHFSIFRVPMPPELLKAEGYKHLTVALAFDPPVRARRTREYIGVEMSLRVIRGKTLPQIEDALRVFTRQEKEDKKQREPITGRFNVKMLPVDSMRNAGISRKRSTLQCASYSWKSRRFGDTYGHDSEWYVVVRAEDKWAKAEIETQSFAVAVVLEADNDLLYNAVKQRVQVTQRERVQLRG